MDTTDISLPVGIKIPIINHICIEVNKSIDKFGYSYYTSKLDINCEENIQKQKLIAALENLYWSKLRKLFGKHISIITLREYLNEDEIDLIILCLKEGRSTLLIQTQAITDECLQLFELTAKNN